MMSYQLPTVKKYLHPNKRKFEKATGCDIKFPGEHQNIPKLQKDKTKNYTSPTFPLMKILLQFRSL
jgi:hypothetical protein